MLFRLTILNSVFVSAAVVAAGALIATSATEAHKDVSFRGSAKDSDGELQSSNKNMNDLHVPRKLADKNAVVDQKGLDLSLHMESREEKTTINIGRNRQLRNTNTKYDAGEREDSIAGDIIIDVGILHGNAVPINAKGERERNLDGYDSLSAFDTLTAPPYDSLSAFDTLTAQPTLSERDQYCLKMCGPNRQWTTAINDFPFYNIKCWNTSQITNMDNAFSKTGYPWPSSLSLRCWDVSSVTTMYRMFYHTSFNGNINEWNVSSVKNMKSMFENKWVEYLTPGYLPPKFNQPLDAWDVSSVTNMKSMFRYSSRFNQTLDAWNVSYVTNMENMFDAALDFNQPLDAWDVSSVTSMWRMFGDTHSFNQPLGEWDVSYVTNMKQMFSSNRGAKTVFNQPVDAWDVSSVINMEGMFSEARAFNQCLSSWGAKLTPNLLLEKINVENLLTDTICPVKGIPDSLDGPWCQDDSNQCYVYAFCFDDPNFQLNGVEHKTCDWVAKQKTEERCKKPGVLSACRQTCEPACAVAAVDCTNDQDFQLNGIKAKTCEWVAKQKTNERCKKPGVMNACRQTCNPRCGCTDITEEFEFQGGMITCEDLEINYCDAELITSGDEFFQQIQDIVNEALIPIHEKLAVVNQQLDAIRDVEDDAEEEISTYSVLDRKTYGDLCANKCKKCIDSS